MCRKFSSIPPFFQHIVYLQFVICCLQITMQTGLSLGWALKASVMFCQSRLKKPGCNQGLKAAHQRHGEVSQSISCKNNSLGEGIHMWKIKLVTAFAIVSLKICPWFVIHKNSLNPAFTLLFSKVSFCSSGKVISDAFLRC